MSFLTHQGGWPQALKESYGITIQETDTLYPQQSNHVLIGNKSYQAKDYCEVVSVVDAETIGTYENDFYKGTPALTKNSFGKGIAYYQACRLEDDFLDDFYAKITRKLGLKAQ
ncbi:beta-galactosidase trimerization domain-containing protein, partial [Latilactobacillus sakei]|uniref:beta-galactosidase trimerization domain-containing protein n=1 Tax=Latilactobacillus sakei TaxID=1599 RepID=UPI003F531D22